jgi:F0F1-type ATP synthase assembly protein I
VTREHVDPQSMCPRVPYNLRMSKTQSKRFWRLSAMGFTFVSMIIAGGLIGWGLSWVFGQAEHERTFIVAGAVIGIVVGMVDFIRDALKAIKNN